MLGQSLDHTLPLGSFAETGTSSQADDSPSRENERIAIAAQMRLWPANPSERDETPVSGVCRDISSAGIGALMRSAPRPGDVYWIEFELEQIGITAVFARCMRCRYINETTYEAGFAFFTRLSLSELIERVSDVDQCIDLL